VGNNDLIGLLYGSELLLIDLERQLLDFVIVLVINSGSGYGVFDFGVKAVVEYGGLDLVWVFNLEGQEFEIGHKGVN
jgi:hypothetical protein